MNNSEPSIVSLLCEGCRESGYCRRSPRHGMGGVAYVSMEVGSLGPQDWSVPLTEGELTRWVPVRVTVKDATTGFGRRLQQAHDLFHQEEYEQAGYLYLDMVAGRADCDEVRVGLAASFFFLGRYEEAVVIASVLSNSLHKEYPIRFESLCAAASVRAAEGEERLPITDHTCHADPCLKAVAKGQ